MSFHISSLSKTILYKDSKEIHVSTDQVPDYLKNGWDYVKNKSKEKIDILDSELEEKVEEIKQEIGTLKKKIKTPWSKE